MLIHETIFKYCQHFYIYLYFHNSQRQSVLLSTLFARGVTIVDTIDLSWLLLAR